MRRWPWTLVLVAGCHRVFGADPSGDAQPPGDDGRDSRPPGCEDWFDLARAAESQGLPGTTMMKAGRFAGSSHHDLALLATSRGGVNVMTSRGDGTFEPAVLFGNPTGPMGIAFDVGDYDGDGDDDIAMGTADGSVQLMETQADAAAVTLISGGAGDVYPAFLDKKDGSRVRLVVAVTSGAYVRFYEQTSGGDFVAGTFAATSVAPSAIVVGNLSHDQVPELVTASAQAITVLTEVSGDYTMGMPEAIGIAPQRLAIGDLEAGAYQDLAAGSPAGKVVVVRGNAGGAIVPEAVALPDISVDGLALVDLDGDGNGELVVLDSASSMVFVVRAAATDAEVVVPLVVGDSPTAMEIVDLDMDGRPDLAVALPSGTIRVYPNCR